MTHTLISGSAASVEPPSPVPGNFADPDLAVFGDRYYLYPTTDGLKDWDATSFSVLSSPDLVDWTNHGIALDLTTGVSWAHTHAWAPAIASRNGLFYLYFTAEDNIGVAVSTSPEGPFRDIGKPIVCGGDFSGRAIDPSVFVDADAAYLYWGNGEMHGVRLNEGMTSFERSDVVTWTPNQFREAAWVHRRNDMYYLSWSVNDTRHEDYRVRYASGPGPFGPWTDRGVLLEKVAERGILATGHHSILNVPGTDEWVIAYHRFAIPDGDGFHREIAFDRLKHSANGLIDKVVPSNSPIRIPIR